MGAVDFVDARHGWVAADDRILATADGGRHWRTQFRTDAHTHLDDLDFVGAAHGWALGSGRLFATRDGGRRWTALGGSCPMLRQLDFVDSRSGYAVAARDPGVVRGGVLFATRDGGRHWTQVDAPRNIQSVCLGKGGDGWLGAGGAIYATTDGGEHWHLSLPRPPGRPTGRDWVVSVRCDGADTAWALLSSPGAGGSPHAALHFASGRWHTLFARGLAGRRAAPKPPGPWAGPFNAISATDAAFVGWCARCGTAPMVLVRDGGARIVRHARTAPATRAFGVSFVSPAQGWIVGVRERGGRARQLIEHTADGGRTWQVQYRAR